MYQSVSTVIAYCAYAVIGVSLPSLIVYIIYPAIISDIMYFRILVRRSRRTKNWLRKSFTILDQYERLVEKQGSKTFLYYEGEKFSYSNVNKEANRLMNCLSEEGGVKLRDVVCMFMYNEPKFVWTWLAIAKCGATAAMLNNHIRGKSLMHCITISEAKTIICGGDPNLLAALVEVKPELEELGIRVFVVGVVEKHLPKDFTDLTELSQDFSERNNVALRKGINIYQDCCAYIYTSGTTGFPKATRMTHRNFIGASKISSIYDGTHKDVLYLCLPLYHGSAFVGLLNTIDKGKVDNLVFGSYFHGVHVMYTPVMRFSFQGWMGPEGTESSIYSFQYHQIGGLLYRAFIQGSSAAIRRTFSVKEFWKDVRRYKITIIQYIGETARYLVQAPRSDQDGIYPHGSIKLAIGNGLTADIWREFKERFNIRRIGEFYGATDGNYSFFNLDGKEGTVGRYTTLQEKILSVLQVLECDLETAEPKRRPDGLCMPCPRGKAGLLVSVVSEKLPYDGYVGGRKITEKKLIRNVLKKGDCYNNTGDLMLIDVDGYVYFKDRLGNTFRWKGENVATTEVEAALLEYAQVESANVYGVRIEGMDGRAGMAALVLQNNTALDCPGMYTHITERLPNYACPKFIRIKTSIEVTGTFKHRKVNLIKEGYDPRNISDPLYFMNDTQKTYSLLDEDSFNDILAGTIRL